jgi:hypothetical protein
MESLMMKRTFALVVFLAVTVSPDARAACYPTICPNGIVVYDGVCPSNPNAIGSCSIAGTCKGGVTAGDCQAQKGSFFGDSQTCVDTKCKLTAYAAHQTVPFQFSTVNSSTPAVPMNAVSWSITNASGQTVANGGSASRLTYPIVVNGQATVPDFAFATSPNPAIVDGQSYQVKAQAIDEYGRTCAATSNFTSQSPGLAVPPSALAASTSGGLVFTWTAPDSRYYTVTAYSLFRSGAGNGPWTPVASGIISSPFTVPAASLNGLGGVMYWAVASVNAVGAGPLAVVQANLPPATPTGLTAAVNAASTATAGLEDLTWSGSMGASSYSVKVATTSGGPYTTMQTVAATKTTLSGLTVGQTHYVVIVANGPTGPSAPSAQVSFLAKKYLAE